MADVVQAYLAVPGQWLPAIQSVGICGISKLIEGMLVLELDRGLAVNQARLAARSDPEGQGCLISVTLDRAAAELWRGGDDANDPLEYLWVDVNDLAAFDNALCKPAALVGTYS